MAEGNIAPAAESRLRNRLGLPKPVHSAFMIANIGLRQSGGNVQRFIALGLLLGLLSGCAAYQERMANQQAELAAEQDAQDDAKCTRYGFTPQTPEYGNCRLLLDQRRSMLNQMQYENIMTIARQLLEK